MTLPRDQRPRQSNKDRYWLKHFADAKKGRRAAPGQDVIARGDFDLMDVDRTGEYGPSLVSRDEDSEEPGDEVKL